MNDTEKIKKRFFTDLVLYALLLVATPFIMLQNYLQSAVGYFSHLMIPVANTGIPVIAFFALATCLVLVILFYKKMNAYAIAGIIIILISIIAGHRFSDFYLGFDWFDLQQNWHYFAYCIFSALIFRYLHCKGYNSTYILRATVLSALAVSTFDETFQAFISSRVFDISDIAKDGFGSVLGLVFIHLVYYKAEWLKKNGMEFRLKSNTSSHPLPELIWIYLSMLSFLYLSSLLTAIENLPVAILISLITTGTWFLIIKNFQNRVFRYFIISFFGLILLIFTATFYSSDKTYLKAYRNGITIYHGLPMIYFDFAVFPDGTFRMTDRKKIFNSKDIKALMRENPDIILVARGMHGKGGEGFPETSEVQFLYNKNCGLPIQIINLKNAEAAVVYNRLRLAGKKVTLIWHNTD